MQPLKLVLSDRLDRKATKGILANRELLRMLNMLFWLGRRRMLCRQGLERPQAQAAPVAPERVAVMALPEPLALPAQEKRALTALREHQERVAQEKPVVTEHRELQGHQERGNLVHMEPPVPRELVRLVLTAPVALLGQALTEHQALAVLLRMARQAPLVHQGRLLLGLPEQVAQAEPQDGEPRELPELHPMEATAPAEHLALRLMVVMEPRERAVLQATVATERVELPALPELRVLRERPLMALTEPAVPRAPHQMEPQVQVGRPLMEVAGQAARRAVRARPLRILPEDIFIIKAPREQPGRLAIR